MTRRARLTVCWITLMIGLVTSMWNGAAAAPPVSITQRQRVIPTYEIGPAETNPMFYDRQSYQGAQRHVYPYALQDQLTSKRTDHEYTSLELENQYIKIAVLPELGGRLFSATDKTNQYDFFYHQHVVKPALIGMLGAWVSGGIEWCVFHHHRNTTFMPVDYTLADNRDGSKTIWFGETERRHRMKWLIGLTLFPDRSTIQAEVKLFNRTAQPHSILYWANVAVHVNDAYQVFFPPSVQVATYHSKVDFTTWPIGSGKYRGYDYTNVDVSWWKNSPVANSFFAWHLRDGFMGGYDHQREAGVVHVADPNVVCGAKLWEWGTGSAGRAWDKILTDNDGPYAELMVGAFSDNQPDYSWIKPHEVKTFKQYWYPIQGIGGIKKANLNGAVNLTLDDRTARFGFCPSTAYPAVRVELIDTKQDTVLVRRTVDVAPGQPFVETAKLADGVELADLKVAVVSRDSKVLIAYAPVVRKAVKELPKPVTAPPKPKTIKTQEELYLTGLRIEQIHNPSVDPKPYYEEAVRRDPGDSRCNAMLAMHANKAGDYIAAEKYLRRAIQRVTAGYTRPKDTEVYYQLGIALRGQHRLQDAYDAFARAAWDSAWAAAARYQLAEIAAARQDWQVALHHVNQALDVNRRDVRALALKCGIMRQLGRAREAVATARTAQRIDPLSFRAHWELAAAFSGAGQADAAATELAGLRRALRNNVESYLELAIDYVDAGMWDDANRVLTLACKSDDQFVAEYPLVHYYLGFVLSKLDRDAAATSALERASRAPADYCFPFRLETADVLRRATTVNPKDARAWYYLGNLMFERQPDVAIRAWEHARDADQTLPTVHRNLGWAYLRVSKDTARAIQSYEQAIATDNGDPRLFLELDELYQIANVAAQERLKMLEPNHTTVVKRQDSFLREIRVLLLNGQFERAIQYLDRHAFHAQEGRRDVHDLFADAHLLQGLVCHARGAHEAALRHFQRAAEYPENLAVGRPEKDPRAIQISYLSGVELGELGRQAEADRYLKMAADADAGHDPLALFYRGLSLRKVGNAAAADAAFARLVADGKKRLQRQESPDFFAKFGSGRSQRAQLATAHLALGVGLRGQGNDAAARDHLEQATAMNHDDLWAAHFANALATPKQ